MRRNEKRADICGCVWVGGGVEGGGGGGALAFKHEFFALYLMIYCTFSAYMLKFHLFLNFWPNKSVRGGYIFF